MKFERVVIDQTKNIIRVTTEDERWHYEEGRTNSAGVLQEYVPSASWISEYAPKGKGFERWLAQMGQESSDQVKEERGEIGSVVHNLIEQMIRAKMEKKPFEIGFNHLVTYEDKPPRPISVTEFEILCSFMRWDKEVQPEYLAAEESMIVNHDPFRPFGGTRDIRARITLEEPVLNGDGTKKKEKGKIVREPVTSLWTIDLKTSKKVYVNHVAQLNGYGMMPGCESDRLAILQIGYGDNEKGWKWNEISRTPELFWAAYTFWHAENSGARPHQRELPLVVSLDHVDANNILNGQLYESIKAQKGVTL